MRIGDVLLSEGLLSEKTLARALELQAATARGIKLGSILLKWDLLAESDLLASLAKLHRCAPVDWATLSRAQKSATRLLSAEQASRLGAVPYAHDGKKLRVAFANPSNIAAVDEVQAITGRRVIAAVTSEVRLVQAQQRFYARPLTREFSTLLQKMESRGAAAKPAAPEKTEAAPTPEHACEDLWVGASPRPESTDMADSLLPMVETSWPAGDSTGPRLGPQPQDSDISAAPAGLAPDPLADDGPLSSFLEGAIGYYAAVSDLDRALESIEVGPVEDLDGHIEPSAGQSAEAAAEESPESLDDTRPSRRKRSPRSTGTAPL